MVSDQDIYKDLLVLESGGWYLCLYLRLNGGVSLILGTVEEKPRVSMAENSHYDISLSSHIFAFIRVS